MKQKKVNITHKRDNNNNQKYNYKEVSISNSYKIQSSRYYEQLMNKL